MDLVYDRVALPCDQVDHKVRDLIRLNEDRPVEVGAGLAGHLRVNPSRANDMHTDAVAPNLLGERFSLEQHRRQLVEILSLLRIGVVEQLEHS
jgi:hypothetical protein